MVFCIALAAWLLTLPAFFRVYYPLLRFSEQSSDAERVVRWLSGDQRQRSLNLALSGGSLTARELEHYEDVRQLFRWFPRATVGFALLTVLVIAACRPSFEALAAAQSRGLIILAALFVFLGAFAWWDWKLLFAWIHQPFFGERSWRFQKDSYSLLLFPARFWRFAIGCVLLGPGLVLGFAALRIFPRAENR